MADSENLAPLPQSTAAGALPFISHFAQAAAIVIALLYAVGLIIVNVDLGRYGLLSMDLARPEFILTGAMWAVLLLASISCYWMISAGVHHVRFNLKTFADRAFYTVVSLGIANIFLAIILFIGLHSHASPHGILWIFLGVLANSASLYPIGASFRRETQRHLGDKPLPLSSNAIMLDSPWKLSGFSLSLAVISFLAGIVWYTFFAFPYISRDWGGGAKPLVTLFLKEKPPTGIPFTANGMTIGPVRCIQETEQSVIVGFDPSGGLAHPVTLAVSRSLINYISYDSSNTSQ